MPVTSPPVPTGRLAPSPTGHLHLGHARTFVLAWAHVRQRGGRLLLRLEDLDASRCRPEYVAGVLRDLEWLGIDWDGPVTLQSARVDVARAAAHELARAGLAYWCACTRADLERANSAPQRGVEEFRYPGSCRGRFARATDARAHGGGAALRFAARAGHVAFEDGVAGACAFDVAAEVGDFVILNRAGVPSYQLAVVIDDSDQGVNEVFRGDDLLSSTSRQLLLLEALGRKAPAWFHVPLVLDADGRRLAKRRDDLSLALLRNHGVDPRAVVSWVARSAGFDVSSRVTTAELASSFELGRASREPVRLTAASIAEMLSARD